MRQWRDFRTEFTVQNGRVPPERTGGTTSLTGKDVSTREEGVAEREESRMLVGSEIYNTEKQNK